MREPHAIRGFTLIELMVVLVIIGLVTAGALLALGAAGGDRALDTETERLHALVRHVREQAELETREYGLRIEPRRYEFVVLDVRSGQWRSVEDDPSMRLRELPEGLRFALEVEGRRIVLEVPKPKRRDDDPAPMPNIMLFSNGDVTPFVITIERTGTDRHGIVRSLEDMNIEMRLPGDEERR